MTTFAHFTLPLDLPSHRRGIPMYRHIQGWQPFGIDGNASGLWSEFARIIGEARPRFVIVENSSELLHRGIDRVLGDLASIGYDAEWHCVPAAYAGAPIDGEGRDRCWIVAYPHDDRLEGPLLSRNLRGNWWAALPGAISMAEGYAVQHPIGSKMNPEFLEWLMGFPIGHTELPPSETQYARRSSRR